MSRLKEVVFGGTEQFNENKTLAEIWKAEVNNNAIAWYIDYYTEDPETFQVRILAEGNGRTVRMTNENKADRDADEGLKWGGVDVKDWFIEDGSDHAHHWDLIFRHASGEEMGIHVEPFRVFAFGPASLSLPLTNMWDAYIEDGILGPVKGTAGFDEMSLLAIAVDSDLYGGQLQAHNLVSHYMVGLASILDG